MTPEESAQMAAMFNWSSTVPMIQKMEVYTFKQHSPKDKKIRLWYEVTALINKDNQWKSIMEKGRTLTEAMKAWSEKWQEMSG